MSLPSRLYKKIVRTYWAITSKYKSSFFYYNLLYRTGLIYNKFAKKEPSKKSGRDIKKILIIYSKNHFDPEKKEELHFSASNLARNIYFTCKEEAEVIYVDQSEEVQDHGKVDLIFGIVSKGYLKYAKKYPDARKILFLVNSHPLWRLRELIKESRILDRALSYSEYASPIIFISLRKYIHEYIAIGNTLVKNSFIEFGIQDERISLINSGVNSEILIPRPEMRPKDIFRVLYVGSHLAIRKGLFRVIEAWKKVEERGINAELLLIGKSREYGEEIDDFVSNSKNAKYLGWIESNTERYREILQSGHVIVNPSVEEGQVGCVLEAMSAGVVPIITENSGVPITDGIQGYIISNGKEIADKIELLANNGTLQKKMSVESRKYIEENHTWEKFNENIRKLIFF